MGGRGGEDGGLGEYSGAGVFQPLLPALGEAAATMTERGAPDLAAHPRGGIEDDGGAAGFDSGASGGDAGGACAYDQDVRLGGQFSHRFG
jgi:hypothetical protein